MSVKSIVVKIAAFVLVIGVLFGVIVFLSQEEKTEVEEYITVYTSNEEDVLRVEVSGVENYALYKENDNWVMEGMEGIGVNNVYAATLVKSMANISAPMLAGLDCDNLSDYGFDNSTVTVKLIYNDGEETIRVGKRSGEYYYVNVMSTKDVYLMPESDLYMLFLDKIKYIDNTVLSFEKDAVSQIEIGDISLEKTGDDWNMLTPYDMQADASVVENEILSQLSAISADEITKAEEKTGKKISVVLSSGECESITVSDENDGYRYVYKENSDYAYKVKSDVLSFVDLTAYSLILKYVAPVSIAEVVKIDFVSANKRTVLEIEAPSTEAPVFYKDGKEAVESSFRSFYQTLMGLTFSGEGEAATPAEYAIIFTKENGEKLDLRFLSLNDGEYSVSINGKTQFKVLKKSVTDIFRALDEIETVF